MPMHAARLALLLLLATGAGAGQDSAQSITVLGPSNQYLADGATALQMGRYDEGVRLSLAGGAAPLQPVARALP
jgi:hypothetical protein